MEALADFDLDFVDGFFDVSRAVALSFLQHALIGAQRRKCCFQEGGVHNLLPLTRRKHITRAPGRARIHNAMH
eukprot:621459-Pyramimonas_sp.AAC.1